jgi:hypothetical protein
MSDAMDLDGIPPEELEGYLAYRDQAAAANISPQTLLATDYLNHFNEIVMMLEMLADCPECIEDAQAWMPKSYQEHFRDSSFKDKELAITAYDHAPSKYRRPFETVVAAINRMISRTVLTASEMIEKGEDGEVLRFKMGEATQNIQRLMDHANAIIHGSQQILGQDQIDSLMIT